ncbi:unnamed protein product [Pleuronectes platessa]|uniref:Uncharacterized protein n=1 Tax=Pleuronectes platessa TaxID=8262 RepID=A0A9N7Z0G0_PLEPL|nr:unnamed protein product [Pleuronectes platessa]
MSKDTFRRKYLHLVPVRDLSRGDGDTAHPQLSPRRTGGMNVSHGDDKKPSRGPGAAEEEEEVSSSVVARAADLTKEKQTKTTKRGRIRGLSGKLHCGQQAVACPVLQITL